MPCWRGDIARFKFDELFASDALLPGRVTCEAFTAAWPSITDEEGFADRMNGLHTFVVSTTLDGLAWNNCRLVTGNVAEEVVALKQLTGQDLLVYGSGELVRMLMVHGLVDECRLLIYPNVPGSGKRFFGVESASALMLVETKHISSGVALLSCRPDGAEAA